MGLRQVEGPPGAPWDREIRGRLDRLVVQSDLLSGNPLNDPARRPLYVYRPPNMRDGERYVAVYVIQGFTGQVDMWLNRTAFEPSMVERLDDMFADPAVPRAVVVFVDAWTSYGGSQFINSASTGPYMDYLCDEIVPFVDDRYPTIADRSHRGITGKSSGGYGAMVLPMMRPDIWGGLASHAGDALFEYCYLPEFPKVVRILRDRFKSSWNVFWQDFRSSDRLDFEVHGTLANTYAMGACYSPDIDNPPRALIPFDSFTGRMIDEVWERWLFWDPIRMAPRAGEALASMRYIYLDGGKGDEYFLELGAQSFSAVLDELGVPHALEIFDGKHGGLQYRYPRAIRQLVEALAR
jgi:S-formylglutathione hydrolase FrmB